MTTKQGVRSPKAVIQLSVLIVLFSTVLAAQSPTIRSISPSSGVVGMVVQISGSGFGASQASSTISLNGTNAVAVSWSDSNIAAVVPTGATSGPFSVTVGGQGVSSSAFTISALPSGWTDADVGTVGRAGSASYANGIFTVSGAGSQIYSTADSFHFVYRQLSGDGSIVARVASIQGVSGWYGAPAVIIRETLTAGAINATAADWPTPGYFEFNYRTTTNGSANQNGSVTTTAPYWLKIVRSGNGFSAYASLDGVNWAQMGSTQTINMAQAAYIGLGVTSGSTAALATATFDNVSVSSSASPAPAITGVSATTGGPGTQVTISGSGLGSSEGSSEVLLNDLPASINSWSDTSLTVTLPGSVTSGPLVVVAGPSMIASNPVVFTVTAQPLPAYWLDADVGSVGKAGSATYASGTFTVKGAGTQIYNNADAFHFAYLPISGNGNIVARVASLQGLTGWYGAAAVMIRETFAPGATNAAVADWPNPGYFELGVRTGANGSTSMPGTISRTVPYWVKVVRSGNSFAGYTSSDGATWTQLGSTQTINMAQNAYVGLGVESGNTTSLGTATFDNVSSTFAVQVPAPSITSISPGTAVPGASVTISGANFGSTQGTSTVTFNGMTAAPTSWGPTTIVVPVPLTATSGNVVVSVGGVVSNGLPFTVSLTPTINSISPTAGPAGIPVTLSGVNFGSAQGTSRVTFNGAVATPTSWSTTSIVVPVPSGATTGNIEVLTSNGSSIGTPFTVYQVPSITSLSSSSATIRSLLTITGTNFGSTQGSSSVTFNGVASTPTSWSPTSIAVPVPFGATTGNVVVTVNSLPSNGVPLTVTLISLPPVSQVIPANTTSGVPLNNRVIVRFAQAIPIAAVIPGTLSLSQSGSNIAGNIALSNDGLWLTFTPSQNLPANASLAVAVTDLAGNQGMPQFQSTFTTGTTTDTVAPTLVQSSPKSNTTGVSTSAPVVVQFSEAIDPATLNPQSFVVTDLVTGSAVPGAVQVDPSGKTASFSSQSNFAVGRLIQVVLNSNIQDPAGNPFSGVGSFTFTTSFAADVTPPQLLATSPSAGVTSVPLNAVFVLQFSKPLNGISVADGLHVDTGGQPVAGAIALSNGNQLVTFTPLGGLAANTTYSVVTTSAMTDVGGLELSNPGSFSITTGTASDATTPSVVAVSPVNSSMGLPTNTVVQLQFNKAIDPLTVTSSTFEVVTSISGVQAAQRGSIAVSADGLSATFTSNGELNPYTTYYVQPTSGIADIAGHGLAYFASSFTTGAFPDVSAPTVQTVSPANGTIGVPVNARIDVLVTGPLNPATVTSGSVVLSANSVQVPGTVSLNGAGMVLTFVSTSPLAPSRTYTVTVSGARDQAGNVLTTFTSTFTTGASSEANAMHPSVQSATPQNGATAVPVGSAVVLTFNEPIDMTTVGDASVPVSVNGISGVLPGTYSIDATGTVLSFTPLSPLPANASVSVQVVANGILDLSGNGSNSYSATFSTGTGSDTISPAVETVIPSDGSNGISLNSLIVLTFSKSVNPSTINANNVGILVNGSAPSNGLGISVSADNRVVTLNPYGLPALSIITVLGTSGVTDLYGNPLPVFESQFTTGFAPSLIAPTVLAQRPGNGATGVPLNDSVVLYLNQPMSQASVTGAFHVSQNGVVVSGTVQATDNAQVVQFVPSAPFQPNSRIQVFLDSTAHSTNGVNVNNYQSSFTTLPDISTTIPTQVSSNPIPSGLSTPTNVAIDMAFNVPIDPATLTSTSILCYQNGIWFQSNISLMNGGTVVQVVPRSPLQPNTYTNCYSSGSLKGTNGIAIPAGGLGFTTGSGADTEIPNLTSLSPADGLTNVGDNAIVRLVFSKPINPLTVNNSTVQLSGGGFAFVPDSVSFSNNNQMALLVPHSPLPDNTQMTLTLSGITDAAGNAVAAQATHFTTGAGPDTTPPVVVWTSPLQTASYQPPTDVPLNASVQIQVNEPVDPGTVNSTTFPVFDSATNQNVNGTYSVSPDGLTVTFVPSEPFAANHGYGANSLGGGMTDLAGNPLSSAASPVMGHFSFTTGTVSNAAAPQVTGITPTSGASNVPINARAVVGFNEPINAAKLTGVTLTGPAGTVLISRTVSNGNQTVSLIPASPLVPNTLYTVSVSGVQDFGGNSLAASITSTFTTGNTADLTTPRIASTIPAGSATGVVPSTAIQVQFTKPINPLTVISSTFYAYPSVTSIPAAGTISVSTDGLVATFTPSEPLASGTQYTVKLTGAITDLEGHTLGTSNYFYFTTGQGGTELPPVIAQLNPPRATVGTTVYINGSYFGTSQGTSTVTFNGVAASVTSWNDAQIVTPVPVGATTGNLVVTVNGVASNAMLFTVQVTPSITSITPASATVGTVLTIAGDNFGNSLDATAVTFSSSVYPFYQSVTPTSWTSNSIEVSVPATAATGNLYVTIGPVGSNALNFTVIPTPKVTDLSTNSGIPGTQVIVNGSKFGNSQGSSIVNFNGVSAAVNAWSDTSITVTAPSNVTTGPVTVVVGSITSNSNVVFTVSSPAIGTLSPPAAAIGATVKVAGSGLTAPGLTTQVFFNGIVANISASSSTSLTVQVPSNAATGTVTVQVGNVSSNTMPFIVTQPPALSGLSSNQGPFASDGSIAWITITGSGFGATQSNSTVNFFGSSTPPTILSWGDTAITLSVPDDATTGPVGISVGGYKAVTSDPFVVNTITRLTDSAGNHSQYVFSVVGGEWFTQNSSGPGCSTCSTRGTVTNTPDAVGNIQTSTDEIGNVTTYGYDGNRNVTSVSQPLGIGGTSRTSYTYNSYGEVLTMTDPLGNVTTNAYDAHGNLQSVTTPAPDATTPASVTQFAYDNKGQLTQITDPLNHVTTLAYNSVGLISSITDAQNHTTSYHYDARGNRTAVIDPINGSAHPTTFTYDIMNRLTGITYPDSSAVGFGYDSRGRRTSVTDQNNRTTTYIYDDADRLTAVTDPANHTTQYAYDTESNLVSITDANNHTTHFAYDERGRVTQTTFPSTLQESYTYDLIGNLTSKTDRKNQTIQYVYDALNRLTSKVYPDATSVDFAYDLAGKVQQVSDPTGNYSFAYDNMGRLIGTTTHYAFLPGSNFQNAYTYDAASNRVSLTAPDNSITTYGYDTLNRLNGMANTWAGGFGFGYDALSRRTSLTRPNGVNTSYAYDSVSHLLSVLHQTGANTLDGAGYTYDPAGNRTSKTNYLDGVTSNYGYDLLYQLTQVTQGASTTESYSYDAVGNRLSSLGVPTYSYNASNQLTSNSNGSYSYDHNGNTLTDAQGRSFTWDFENRLVQAVVPGQNGGTTTFKYDPFGRRIQKAGPLGTTNYLYDGPTIVDELDNSGNVLARYATTTDVDEPLSELRGSTGRYYQQDGLGSVTSLSNGSGALANTYTFDSFGKLNVSTGTITNPFQYTGREADQETGLYYYRARYYDPNVGRFISEDPIVFAGSGTNFYAYVWNSPVALFDPSGFVGIEKPTTQQLGSLAALFPGAYVDYSNRNVVVPMPCADVQKILEQNGFATADNTDFNRITRYFLFGHTSDHPSGTQVRHKPTRPTDPDPNVDLHIILEDTHQTCPDSSCTITGAHNDPHNPMNGWTGLVEHFVIDWIPYRLGF